MKVLLINPPTMDSFYGRLRKRMTVAPPINLAYLAAPVEQAGYKVEILDANALELDERQIRGELVRRKPDLVGITVNTPLFLSSIKILRLAKEILPAVVTVIGGAHPTACPQEVARYDCCDFVVYGEGDVTFLELIRTMEKSDDVGKVKGILYRENSQVIKTSPRELVSRLDQLPLPAYHLLPLARYRPSPQHMAISDRRYVAPLMVMLTTRGCPYSCKFCTVHTVFGKKVRFRSVESVLKEIKILVNELNIRRINFLDDTFTVDKKRVHEICNRIIEEKIDFRWTSTTRVDCVNEELLEKMKAAGCEIIFYGMESGDQGVLDGIDKKITLEQIREAVYLTKKTRIGVVGSFMIGNLNETRKTINDTIDFAKQLNCDFVHFSIVTLYPGSELYSIAVKEGKNRVKSWEEFRDSEYNPDVAYCPDGLVEKDLARAQKRAYREFYLRPRYILGRVKTLVQDPTRIKYYAGGLLAYTEVAFGRL